MKEFVKMVLATLTAFIFVFMFIVLVFGALGAMRFADEDGIENGTWLVVDIYGDIPPYNPPDDVLAEIFGHDVETLDRILNNLDKAAVDDRIEGVLLKVSSQNTLGGAAREEIRGKIHALQDAGKKVYAYSDNLNRSALHLASACDSIFVPLYADVTMTGMGGTLMYLRGLLDKLDIHPNLHRIADYKSAAEPFLRKDMSPEAREMYGWMLDDMWDLEVGAIAEDRGMTMDQVNDIMEYALFTAPEAREAGLVDEILYWSDVVDSLGTGDDDLKTVSSAKYADVTRESVGLKGDKRIAIVHAQGMIGGRHNRTDPMWGLIMGHESIGRELKRVAEDDKVAAVVFRVSSNGGSSLTSDLIAHEVERLAAKKPVVASMGDVAASGGYMISYRASKVIADPTTITGSIGSITGKINVAGMYEKIGITFDRVSKGPNSFFWSDFSDFNEKQRARMEDNHWNGFNLWLEDVSEKRGIEMEELEKLVMGRVWTGRQASENGLIDEVGGLDRAVELAKELAGIPEDEDVTIVNYPRKKGLLEMIAGGDLAKSAVRSVLYRFIREDLAASMKMLVESSYVLMP